ncbi:N-acetylmuramoyl-L-alanine amidase [Hansschlegelia quercus]|uniref:N-acetylmuramoyl-L-alanine amidase n=1 Tax=Hansschlegelia quercus TaxID=2528245 RepID=A0A4Q9GAD4_9HYPH|nr:N-acetylmuramoyl-L-alanine amidase [Hansschlegelia quercus]TBN47969.1 N-acetylmuramoyl-L-alanine amidase [Hansschlegelia quercus]
MTFSADSPLVDEVRPAANHDERRDERSPDILLLHYTGMESTEEACVRLCEEASGVSCHYVVFEDGRVLQLVPEERRAWHAGLSSWEDETDVNSRSIGIEIGNPGHEFGYVDFPQGQVDAVIALARDICARRQIATQRVLAHSDVAPRRKQDPGERFPWNKLFAAGVGHWTVPTPVGRPGPSLAPGEQGTPVEQLQTLLSMYGYGIEIDGSYGPPTVAVVAAFQRHFRQRLVDGIADFSTTDTLRRLLKTLPAI